MLVPANNIPWKPHRLSQWVDPSAYIKRITQKWAIRAVENIEVTEDIEKSISYTISKIHQEMLRLRNYNSNHSSVLEILEGFSKKLFPLLKDLDELKNESLDEEEILKCDKIFEATITEISWLLWIPQECDIESKINKIADLIERYSQKWKRATE